jgi:hypothetical protein
MVALRTCGILPYSTSRNCVWEIFDFCCIFPGVRRSQWPRGLRRRTADARLLRLWVRIPPGAWMFVCFKCCVLSGRGLCDELITRPEDSYRLWCVVVCDLEKTSRMRSPWPAVGRSATKNIPCLYRQIHDAIPSYVVVFIAKWFGLLL